jgi:hypothetical protein
VNRLAQGATIGAYTLMSAAAIVTLTAIPAWHADNERADRAVTAAAAAENWAEARDNMSERAQDLATDPVTPVTPEVIPAPTLDPDAAAIDAAGDADDVAEGDGDPGDGEVIMEDDPRWDCATMGNRVCGPEVPVTPIPAVGADWQGFTVGEVIVCPPGWTVAVDTYPDGATWASCQ